MWRKQRGQKSEDRKENMAPEFEQERSAEEVNKILKEYMEQDHSGHAGKKSKAERLKKIRKSISCWSRRKKAAAGAAVLLAVLFLCSRIAGGGKDGAVPVSVHLLEKGDVTSVLSLSGPVSGTDSADVVSNLHAEVLEILVKEGDPVKKGQVLARLDSTDVQRTVDIARNSYELAVSEYNENIRDTQSGYEKAVQDYQTARLAYDRNRVLYEAGDISRAEFETADNALKDASRQVSSYTVSEGRAVPDKSFELKVQSAQYELDQRQKELEDTEVRSPIDGTVTRVNSRVGQFADKPEDDKPMFVIENLEGLEMEIAVSEYSVGQIRIGQSAVISADILNGKTAEGKIVSISPTGEEKGGGSAERVVPATIQIEGGSQTGLIAGITARASVTTGTANDTFKVPQTALIVNEDGSESVACVEPESQTVHFIRVKTGLESDLETEIFPETEGELEEGMEIIVSPSGLEEGMAVTVNRGGGL